ENEHPGQCTRTQHGPTSAILAEGDIVPPTPPALPTFTKDGAERREGHQGRQGLPRFTSPLSGAGPPGQRRCSACSSGSSHSPLASAGASMGLVSPRVTTSELTRCRTRPAIVAPQASRATQTNAAGTGQRNGRENT